MRTLVSLGALLLLVSTASAQIVYQSQTRDVIARAGFINPLSSISSTGLGVFDRTLDIDGPNPENAPDSTAFAHQYSELNPGWMTMFGRLGGTDNYPSVGAGEGAGRADLNVNFMLANDAPFSLTANESSLPRPSTLWFVTLTSGSQTVLDWEAWPFSALNFSVNGVLPAGSYQLDVEFYDGWQGAGVGSRFSNYAMTFAVPEPSSVALLTLGLFRRRRR
jgi:hypothetical protein